MSSAPSLTSTLRSSKTGQNWMVFHQIALHNCHGAFKKCHHFDSFPVNSNQLILINRICIIFHELIVILPSLWSGYPEDSPVLEPRSTMLSSVVTPGGQSYGQSVESYMYFSLLHNLSYPLLVESATCSALRHFSAIITFSRIAINLSKIG